MRPALDGGSLTVAGDHAHALVQPRDDVVGRAGLQKGDAIVAAGGKDAVARSLHLRRKRLARHGAVAERKTEVARTDFGKAEAGYAEDLLAIGDALRTFQLHAEQELAARVERPGIAAFHIVLGREPPDRRRCGFRSAPACADAEELAPHGVATAVGQPPRALHPRQRRRNFGIDTWRVVRIAAGF